MELGVVGSGKMGRGLAARAAGRGHRVVGWDPEVRARAEVAGLRDGFGGHGGTRNGEPP